MFDPVRHAKMTPSNVAKLLNVSRVAVSLWMNGHSEPHHLIERRVKRLLSAVDAAVKDGKLPLSEDVPRQNRHAEIAKVIHRQLEKMNLSPVSD
jgi:predicted transcriptional regulator